MSDATWFNDTFSRVRNEVKKCIIGQDSMVEDVLVGMATGGHVLLEGMPGLGKTLMIKTLSQALSMSFNRIQFTPDMMPADVTGTQVLNQDSDGKRSFEFRPGPIFAHIVLADEINRATPKTQAALLEAMQEGSVTQAGVKHSLPQPFLVMATQNPIEQEGTYPLPEAQLDRFLFKILVPSPSKEELAAIVGLTASSAPAQPEVVANPEDLLKMRALAREVPIAPDVLDFGLGIVMGTHPQSPQSSPVATKYCRYGSSPRGAQAMVGAAKVYALLNGRFNVSKEDLKRAAKVTLRHRIGLNFEAEADGYTADQVVAEIVQFSESKDKDPVRV